MKVYTIKKGDHSPFRLPAFTTSDVCEFEVMFDNSAIYTTKDPVNQYDINKLFGLSDGLNHDYNSARFGWNYIPDTADHQIKIYSYCYINGERIYKKLWNLELNIWYRLTIELNKDTYDFFIDGELFNIEMTNGSRKGGNLKYKLFPYFGGDEVAPHDIKIYFK